MPFDERSMYDWALKIIHAPNTLAIRDEDGFGIASVSSLAWEPGILHGAQQFIAVRKKRVFLACKLTRVMAEWATRAMGAVDYHFGEMTGMNMQVVAKRIGAVPNSPTFVYKARVY